jgi:murein DD-endopeptidase MepM/ murein hydrolase activator NlpD
MRQQYFILDFAHSFHGKLRQFRIPHKALYYVFGGLAVLSLALLILFSTYMRMSWKVANYNSLRQEIETLRSRYQALQNEANEKTEQLASLQLLASEVSVAYGIKQKLEGPPDIQSNLVPTFRESLAEYDFLKSATYSMVQRQYARRWQLNVRPSLWPVYGRLMSSYGGRSDPFSGGGAFHAGVDVQAPVGTPVRASADGVIKFAQWSGHYGRLVIIDHGNGMETYYAHLSRFYAVPGQEIRQGQVIAYSGESGRATGPHLHYEVRVGGTPINPYPFLTKTSLVAVQKDLPL